MWRCPVLNRCHTGGCFVRRRRTQTQFRWSFQNGDSTRCAGSAVASSCLRMKGSSVQAAVEDARARLKSASDAVENASIANGDTQALLLAKHTRMVDSHHTQSHILHVFLWREIRPFGMLCNAAYDVLWVHEVQHAPHNHVRCLVWQRTWLRRSMPVSRWTSGE